MLAHAHLLTLILSRFAPKVDMTNQGFIFLTFNHKRVKQLIKPTKKVVEEEDMETTL